MQRKITVPKFWLQPTPTFFDGPPQREEYDSDSDFLTNCLIYEYEWKEMYICADTSCKNYDCPQHSSKVKTPTMKIITDQQRMDWLVGMAVEVRSPALYGSRALFHAREISDHDEPYQTSLREQIDACIRAGKSRNINTII